MKKKKSVQEEINEFLQVWDFDQMADFLRNVIPLIELYDVEPNNDWVKDAVQGDEENIETIRIIRTVYLVSKIAKDHAAKLAFINIHFKDLRKKMECNNQ